MPLLLPSGHLSAHCKGEAEEFVILCLKNAELVDLSEHQDDKSLGAGPIKEESLVSTPGFHLGPV